MSDRAVALLCCTMISLGSMFSGHYWAGLAGFFGVVIVYGAANNA